MKKIIVRADDLGFTEGINYGIDKACRDGIIRSVGVMTNMSATRHGYELVKDLDLCLGLHTNICAGKPICDSKDVPSLCDDNGYFKKSRVYREAAKKGEDFVVLDEVIKEVEAQYEAFVELTGDKPHYFEGHAVASENFFKGMQIVAAHHGCDYLGVSFGGSVKFRNTNLHVSMDSMGPRYVPFESLKRAAMEDYDDGGVLMFVCHPGYLDQEILDVSSLTIPRPAEVAMCIAPETRQWLKDNDIEVITYDDIS